MNDTIALIGIFTSATGAADAIDELHRLGIPDEDVVVMTGIPYPEQALGRHQEWIRLPYIVLGGALAGFMFGMFLAVVTPALYPLTLGGRSIVAGPPAAVIVYVFTMMATIVSTFLGVIWEMGFPSFTRKYYDEQVTSGGLAVLLKCSADRETEIAGILSTNGGRGVSRPEKMAL